MASALERAIEAVANTASDDPKEDNFEAVARAVLMAVREGSPEIFAAMEAAQPKWPSSQCDNARELAASSNDPKLRAAIDAILNEKE